MLLVVQGKQKFIFSKKKYVTYLLQWYVPIYFLKTSITFFSFRVDSVMLLEEGFEMVSADASDKMLKEAYKTRWDRRKEPAFDKWSEFFNY